MGIDEGQGAGYGVGTPSQRVEMRGEYVVSPTPPNLDYNPEVPYYAQTCSSYYSPNGYATNARSYGGRDVCYDGLLSQWCGSHT